MANGILQLTLATSVIAALALVTSYERHTLPTVKIRVIGSRGSCAETFAQVVQASGRQDTLY